MILLSLTILLASLIFRKYILKGIELTNINLGSYKEIYVTPYIKRTEEDLIEEEKSKEITKSKDIKLEDIIRMWGY